MRYLLDRIATTTAILHHRAVTGVDVDGNDTYTDTTTDVPGCIFDPGGSTESNDGRTQVTTTPTLYAPETTPLPAAIDWIDLDGTRYEIDGKPKRSPNPFQGWDPRTIIKLIEVTG